LRAVFSMPGGRGSPLPVTGSLVWFVLSVGFWLAAARQFSPTEIGVGFVAVALINLVAEVAHLGLRGRLVRVVPRAEGNAQRLVAEAYGLAAVLSTVLAGVFIVGLDLWASGLSGLRASPWSIGLFVVATIGLVLYRLAESVLSGLGQARWVVALAAVVGVTQLIAVFPLAGTEGWERDLGVFVAWALPLLIASVLLNAFAINQIRSKPGTAESKDLVTESLATPRLGLWSVLAPSWLEWGAGVARGSAVGLLPLIVLGRRGPVEAANFAIAWTISFAVYLAVSSLTAALIADPPVGTNDLDRRTLRFRLLTMTLAAAVVIVAFIAAPMLASLFGASYEDGASALLRLLLFAAVAQVVVRSYLGRLRADKEMGTIVVVEGTMSVAVILFGWLLLELGGLVGLGVAWLVVHLVVATYVLAADSVWWWGPKLSGRSARLADNAAAIGPRLAQAYSYRALNERVSENLDALYATRPSWNRVAVDQDRQSIVVAGHDGRPPLRIELAISKLGSELLAKRVAAASELNQLTGLASVRGLVPYPIDYCRQSAMTYLVESTITGRTGIEVDDVALTDRVGAVAAAVGELHRATSGSITIDRDSLDRMISLPLRYLGDVCNVTDANLLVLTRTLYEAFDGSVVPTARLHGDLKLERALFDATGKLTGLVGWEWSEVGPVLIDWGSLALSSLAVDRGQDVGQVVRGLLRRPDEFVSHDAFVVATPEGIEPRAQVLFAWLHYVLPELRSAAVHGARRYWLARQVHPVMAELAASASSVLTTESAKS